jgi:PKD repeat protein
LYYGQAEDYTIRFLPNTQPPVANFSISNINTCQGIVSFLDKSSSNATTWQWNFGDGTTSNVQNPTHTYTTAGTYTVVLIASNQYGSHFYSLGVTVSPLEFSIQILGTPAINQLLNFSSSLSTATTYNWDFGDGYSSGLANPNHTYTTIGTYIVSLTCIANGCVNTAYDTITIIPVGIEHIDNNGLITISPNPFMESTRLVVKLLDNVPLIIDLYAISGQKLYSIYENPQCTKGEYEFSLSSLASGTYFVQIKIGEKRYYKKIVAIQP